MDGVDPGEVASQAQKEIEANRAHARTVLEWLLDAEHLGEMYPRDGLITELAAQTDLDPQQAASGVRGTVGDVVDPVQQVSVGGQKYVGVIEYHTYSAEGAYGYVQYHDRHGKRRRVVCAKCVEDAELDENVTHATQGAGSASDDATWEELLGLVSDHYQRDHGADVDSIDPGASLLSNTTIAGNKAFHAGNDGAGSGLDADTLQNKGPGGIGGSPPIYGDGSDGVVSDPTSLGGRVFAESVSVSSGHTVNVTSAVLFLAAQTEIVIEGTIDAKGSASNGGGQDSNGRGETGGDGLLVPMNGSGAGGNSSGRSGSPGEFPGGGGSGGDRNSFNAFGAAGGDAGGVTGTANEKQIAFYGSTIYDKLREITPVSSGGGGGGRGVDELGNGGSGGGNGGDGGGTVVLLAPSVTVSGTVICDGGDGGNGSSSGQFSGAGGGGGGGSGGTAILMGKSVTNNGTYSFTGGAGGAGGSGSGSSNPPGGDGADGADGIGPFIITQN